MQKLKDALDERGVEWEENNSDPEEPWQLERIAFKVGKTKWSVICGEISSGGKSGKLEIWNGKKSMEPIGHLGAREVLWKVGLLKPGQLGVG